MIYSKSIRNTKPQQIEYSTQFNYRKLNEFPHFISKLNNKYLKSLLLKKQIYFNYEFINAKTKLNDILFLNEFSDSLWSYYNEYAAKNTTSKNPFKTLLIIHFLYTQNSLILNKYQNSIIIYLLPKLYDYYKYDNDFKQFIQDSLANTISKSQCCLIPLYNFLPSLNENAIRTTMLLYDHDKIEYIFSFKNRVFISCSAVKLYIHDDIRLYCSISLTNTSFDLNQICFSMNEILNNFDGCILIGNEKNLIIIELNDDLASYTIRKIELDGYLNKLMRLRQNFYLVSNENSIEIFEFGSNRAVLRKNFEDKILNVISNVDNQFIGENDFDSSFILVMFQDYSIKILRLDEGRLEELLRIPSTKFGNCLSFVIDENIGNEVLLRFGLLFEKGNFIGFNVDKKLFYDLVHVGFNFKDAKDNSMSLEINLAKILDFIDNILLFKVGRYLYLFNLGKFYFQTIHFNFRYD
jgi:hypothetical protein